MHNLAAERIKKELGLKPHPEGGWYAETFRDTGGGADARGHSTAIYFLLEAGDVSHWHRVIDAAEVWHFYAGAPLVITGVRWAWGRMRSAAARMSSRSAA